MPDVDPTRGDTRRADRLERALILALLDPPAYGGFLPDLARQLGESEADTRAAAHTLQERLLANAGGDYIAASPALIELDRMWPLAL